MKNLQISLPSVLFGFWIGNLGAVHAAPSTVPPMEEIDLGLFSAVLLDSPPKVKGTQTQGIVVLQIGTVGQHLEWRPNKIPLTKAAASESGMAFLRGLGGTVTEFAVVSSEISGKQGFVASGKSEEQGQAAYMMSGMFLCRDWLVHFTTMSESKQVVTDVHNKTKRTMKCRK